MVSEKYIHFDWAVKVAFHDSSYFFFLNGFLSALLNEKIDVICYLESKSRNLGYDDRFNHTCLKAKNEKGDLIIIEIVFSREAYFIERTLTGVSKAICEHVSLGKDYDKVKKVYSVNILYFDMGTGKDYLYHGKTEFKGVFSNDILQISRKQQDTFRKWPAGNVFPEYYLIRVNKFNELAKTPIEEWMEYIKDGVIKDDTTVPGLQEAREKLKYISMTPEERLAYERHLDNVRIQNDVICTAKTDGLVEGEAIGLKKGKEEGLVEGRAKGILEANIKNARNLKQLGVSNDIISKATGLSIEEIEKL